MNDEESMPIHEQAYRVVVEGQEAEERHANAWRGGTNYGRSSFAQLGALIGGACGWLFGRALRFVFVTMPMTAIGAFKRDRSNKPNPGRRGNIMKGNEPFICIALVLATGGCAEVTAPLARAVTAATTPVPYRFEAANYWGNHHQTIANATDPQDCARRFDADSLCRVASFSGPRAPAPWANTCPRSARRQSSPSPPLPRLSSRTISLPSSTCPKAANSSAASAATTSR